jgi:hypothetical protein
MSLMRPIAECIALFAPDIRYTYIVAGLSFIFHVITLMPFKALEGYSKSLEPMSLLNAQLVPGQYVVVDPSNTDNPVYILTTRGQPILLNGMQYSRGAISTQYTR